MSNNVRQFKEQALELGYEVAHKGTQLEITHLESGESYREAGDDIRGNLSQAVRRLNKHKKEQDKLVKRQRETIVAMVEVPAPVQEPIKPVNDDEPAAKKPAFIPSKQGIASAKPTQAIQEATLFDIARVGEKDNRFREIVSVGENDILSGATLIREGSYKAKVRPTEDGGGVVRDSTVVLEREWSDGLIDFRCAFDGCRFVNTNHKSVSNHYGSSKSHGKAEFNQAYKDPTRHWEVESRTQTKLTIEITQAIESGMTDPEDIARFICELRKRDEDTDKAPAIVLPKTDANLLAEIGNLLLEAGKVPADTRLEGENETLKKRVEVLEDELKAANDSYEEAYNEYIEFTKRTERLREEYKKLLEWRDKILVTINDASSLL